jgi:L-rhamnose isomerase
MGGDSIVEKAYSLAKDQYAQIGVDMEKVLDTLSKIKVSIHCWQGDDVGGFEKGSGKLEGGGIQATGNYPGKARTIEELRSDIDKAVSLIPGTHRLNLHASYLDNRGKFVERNEIGIEHFQSWIDWAKENRMGMDFNPTYFSHPKADTGFTLSSADKEIRQFWIEHGIACRKIAEQIGLQINSPCVTNFWIPDGFKDIPIDRKGPRERLMNSLDEIFAEKIDNRYELDCVESKLFGIGSESYVTGSHEFYLGYATSRNILLCLDTGHFHPTEMVSDKLSSVLCYLDEVLLHVSRGVRWDSDHVVTLSDELLAIAQELVRGGYLDRVHIGLDFFDASINWLAALVIVTRCMIKALLYALLSPSEQLNRFELEADYTSRLAMLEEVKTMPFGAVWDYYCLKHSVPTGMDWLAEVKKYEKQVLSKRT